MIFVIVGIAKLQKNTIIKEVFYVEENEEILCGYSSARETDNMFKLLLENLKKDNLLEETIIIAFGEHPNRIVIKEDETEILNRTSFFIYERGYSIRRYSKREGL